MNTTATPRPGALNATKLKGDATTFWDASIDWVTEHWFQVLIAMGIGVAIFLALVWLRSIGKKLYKRDVTGDGWYTVLARAIARTTNSFIITASAQIVVAVGDAPSPIVKTVQFLFTIAIVLQGAIWARELILGAIQHRTKAGTERGESLANAMGLIRVFVSFAVFSIALVMILGNLGVNVTGLVAGLGVGGIAIGLAAQSIFADLIAAISIIFDRPFRKGDAITYDKSSGTVELIGMRSTRIRGVNGEQRVIGNKKLLDYEIINNSQRDYRRVIFTLGVVQTTPVDVMNELPHMLKAIVEDHGQKFVRSGFVGFGAQSYDFEVQFDTLSAALQDMYDARHSIGLAIVQRFNDEGIALAYPTQTAITAQEAGMIVTAPRPDPDGRDDNERISRPPSSGDRSTADEESTGS